MMMERRFGEMSESGGAIAIWHDIVPEGLDEFYAWHGEEHMPERVAIPGFLRGRRFIAIEADRRWFNLYETASSEIVRGADYRKRLDNPTPRTLSAVRHFRDVARSLCSVAARMSAAESGMVEAGLLATMRYDIDEAGEARHLAALRDGIMAPLAACAGIAAVSLLVADRAASGYVNAEQRARGSANAVPPLTLIVEGWADEARFREALSAMAGPSRRHALGLSGEAILGIYRHELTIARAQRSP